MNKLAKLLGILEIVKNNITLPYCQGAEFLGCSAFRFLFYTSEVEVINTEEISVTPTIKEIVANDMRKYAEEMNISERQLIKDFANNTNVVLRTLQRILEGNRKITPHVTTVVDIYSQIYNATSLAEIISKAPPVISEFIKKNHMQFIGGSSNKFLEVSNNSSAQANLTSSSTFNQIYLMTSGDFGTDLATIRENFGANGLKQLDEMIKQGFVEVDENEQIKRKKYLTWDRTIRKNFLKTILADVYKEENSDTENSNYIGVAVGDVTPADYDLIREKMRSHFLELMEVINNSKPTYEEAVKITFAKVMDKIEFKVEGDKLC
jgi:hypothetical protein